MTALNYILKPDIAIICADTLQTGTDKQPIGFASKVLPLPHLHGVVSARGSLRLLLDWYVFIQRNVVALDMRDLDDVTPQSLRELWHQDDTSEGPESSSIYHFGLDRSTGQIEGWAYSSREDFRSELLIHNSVGLKPGPAELVARWRKENETTNTIHAFINLMQAQQDWDRSQAVADQSGIGGEMHILALTKNCQTLWACYQLRDFGVDYQFVRDRVQPD